MTIEAYLASKAVDGPIEIVGGSALFTASRPDGISINGFRTDCCAAAINSKRSDIRRVQHGKFPTVLCPRPNMFMPDWVLIPEHEYELPKDWPGRQATTCFSLVLICMTLGLTVDVYGICGWASKWHYGDWEMWWMKGAEGVTVHDPRPRW